MFLFEDENMEEYKENIRVYLEKIDQIKSMKTFVLTNQGSRYSYDSVDIFNIRGTRVSLMIKKCYWPAGIGDFFEIIFLWQIKKKNKKEYTKVSLEDVLDSSLISNRAKEEILFNLNVFLT